MSPASDSTPQSLPFKRLHHEHSVLRLTLDHFSSTARGHHSWSQQLRPGAVHAVLNLSGQGLIISSETRLTLLPKSAAVFLVDRKETGQVATRIDSVDGHDFLLLTIDSGRLDSLFGKSIPLMKRNLGVIRRWTDRERHLYDDLTGPPVAAAALDSWYKAKILELLSVHLFPSEDLASSLSPEPEASSGHRHVDLALSLLAARYNEPLNLRELAREVGCAHHYLSRLVKEHTGKPLSLHLREQRIDRAAILLANGRLNVTEVALEVGYNSLSHFAKAFAEEEGCRPSDFIRQQTETIKGGSSFPHRNLAAAT